MPQEPSKSNRAALRETIRSLVTMSCAALATDAANAAERNLADLSIEELMNETITSVSKKEQRLGDAAAAVAVLTNDDLRRSGATNVADALRVVPGLSVGSLNASEWAISARGFNQVYANKLLVLVDGRAVYTALFGGVYWDLQQMPLEDIDRIEIIRGPGATIWGANAVNGVINVVTRSAKETQGAVAYAGFGSGEQSLGGLRFGDQLGEHTFYRVFADHKNNPEHALANGAGANDGWQTHQGGFRVDTYPHDSRHVTWQADFTGVERDDASTNANNVNTLARWTENLSERSTVDVQAYYDHTYRNEDYRSRNSIDTFDVTAQHRFALGQGHEVIWGAGFRHLDITIERTGDTAIVRDGDAALELFSAFVQDEYYLIPDRLLVTAGTKLEHHEFTGFEWLPSISAAFMPDSRQTIWASVSRAVVTPNVLQASNALDVIFGTPFQGPGGFYLPVLIGNEGLQPEVLKAYELGYRVQPTAYASVDAAFFYNEYENGVSFGDIASLVPGAPFGFAQIPWVNGLSARTHGAEISVTVSPAQAWRLTGAYSYLSIDAVGSGGVDPGVYKHSSPRHQATLRSAYDIGSLLSLNAQLRFVDGIGGIPGVMGSVPSYLTADVSFSYRPTASVELSLVGQNLLRDRQLEQPPIPPVGSAEVPRSVYGKLTWRF
jgi:iron complex outermembrane recepter protein